MSIALADYAMSVYGLFDGRKCIYVGRTAWPKERLTQHRTNLGRKVKMKVFAVCHPSDGCKKEIQFIREYKARGEAVLNRYVPQIRAKTERATISLYRTDKEYLGQAGVDRADSFADLFHFIVKEWKAGNPVLLQPQKRDARRK